MKQQVAVILQDKEFIENNTALIYHTALAELSTKDTEITELRTALSKAD